MDWFGTAWPPENTVYSIAVKARGPLWTGWLKNFQPENRRSQELVLLGGEVGFSPQRLPEEVFSFPALSWRMPADITFLSLLLRAQGQALWWEQREVCPPRLCFCSSQGLFSPCSNVSCFLTAAEQTEPSTNQTRRVYSWEKSLLRSARR